VPIKLLNGRKPIGIKRISDLINFKIDIPDLLKYLD